MKRWARVLLLGCVIPSLVLAATPSTPPPVTNGTLTYYWDGTKNVATSPTNPLPVNATVTATATTTATASSTPTAVSAGPGAPLNIDLHSALFVQPTFAGTPVDGTHGLPINCISGCSGGAADESAFTAGTTSVFTGGFFQTTATSNPLTTGQIGVVQMTANRAFMVNLRNASGAELGVAAAPVQVSLANTAANATPVSVAGTGTAGTANAGVVTVQGIASMTKLLVTPDSVALPANQSVNTAQVNGVTTLTGTGAVGTGAQRVAVGTDTATIAGSAPGTAGSASANVVTVQGVASMTKLLVTPDSVALPANQSVNTAQVNGVTTLTGTGAVGTGSQRVAVGTDTATIAGSAPGTAGSASTNVVTVQGIASGTTLPTQASSQYPIGAVAETASATGTTGATTATLATNTGQTTFICSFSIRANATGAATGNATVTGTITGTLNFTQWTAPLASGLGVTEMIFTPCVPASTTNTSIAVVSAAPGSGGVVSVSATGFLK